jgi:5-methylcytosine-specific restriction protein B
MLTGTQSSPLPLWGIHAGATGDADTLFLTENCVAIGWEGMGDLSQIASDRTAFKTAVEKVYPHIQTRTIVNHAGQLFRFLHEMKPGDWIAYPSKSDKQIHIGVITGPYQFIVDNKHRYPNRRMVQWKKAVPRTHFTQGARNEISSAMSLFQIKTHAKEFFNAASDANGAVVVVTPPNNDNDEVGCANMIPKAKHHLLDQYANTAAKLSPEMIEAKRQAFLTKFPPSSLATLSGDALMAFFHEGIGEGGKTTFNGKKGLFYELEFGADAEPFGGIAGGSALKYKIYRAADGTGYRKKGQGNVPVPCSDAEAVQITADIARSLSDALNLADSYHLAVGDRAQWQKFEEELRKNTPASVASVGTDSPVTFLGWGHKYLAICRPDLFSFHQNPRQLRTHLVRLGVLPTEDNSHRYLLDWQWRFLRENAPDLKHCNPVLLSHAAYAAFGPETSYWRIGTDEQTGTGPIDRWTAMRAGGFASVGWGDLGDLRLELAGLEGTKAIERLKTLLSARYQTAPQQIGRWAVQIHQFYAKMRPGDRIMAMKGHQICGIGEIAGEYDHYPGDLQPHHRPVIWRDITPGPWPDAPGFRTTVYDFSDRATDAVRVETAFLSGDLIPISAPPVKDTAPPPASGGTVTLPLSNPVPLQVHEQRIKDILERKGQVILYGPPGTGKTYNARQTARELVARERCGGRDWAMLSEAERQTVDDSISFVTFHPAYAYEDFIEGYRPLASSTGSGPAFELRDGLFVEVCERARRQPDRHFLLLIDEINRGNVAAVLGELITLLEADKRDSVAAILPLSRRAFRVPANLWIIGTMNTADRSISLLDAALRRRFGFVELLPEPERVAVNVNGLQLSALLKEINARIRKHVTRNARELQVGHAYLMRGGQALQTPEDLLAAFRDDILPLLAEYCFENYATLARIVGDEIIDAKEQTPSPTVCADPAKLHKALLRLVSADPARDSELGDESEESDSATDGTDSDVDDDASGDAALNGSSNGSDSASD